MSALEAAKEIDWLSTGVVRDSDRATRMAEIIDRLAVQPAVKSALAERDAEPDWHKFYTESQVNYLHCQELLAERDARVEEMRECLRKTAYAIRHLNIVFLQRNNLSVDDYEEIANASNQALEAERILAQAAPTVPAPVKEG